MRFSLRASTGCARLLLLGLALALAPVGCQDRAGPGADAAGAAEPGAATYVPLPTPPELAGDPWLDRRAPGRLVAFGDLHGDLEAARRALRLAGAVGPDDRWIGGDLVVVQLGDQLDRGDEDRAILDLFTRLPDEAARAGGTCIPMLGNHELGNALGYHRSTSVKSLAAFADITRADLPPGRLDELPSEERGRAAAFLPGGPYARMLSERPVVVRVNDTLFVHGGLLPHHLEYGLPRVNAETRAWLRGERPDPPEGLFDRERSLTWVRQYALGDPGPAACAALSGLLARLGARRMAVGHTIQDDGVSSACDGQVWRLDVGMSGVYGGPIQALLIDGGRVQVLTDPDTAARRAGPEPIPRLPSPIPPEPKTP